MLLCYFRKLNRNISEEQADFTLFNLNIQSLSKIFDELKQCLKSVNHNFIVIGLFDRNPVER